MKKYFTLAAITAILGITWAAAAPLVADKAQAASDHQHGKSQMQGMHAMGGMKGPHGHAKDGKHDHEMMACDTTAHGAGQHRHEAPAK